MRAKILWMDDKGNHQGFKRSNGKPRLSTTPYLYDIAAKKITDHWKWSKVGYNTEISTTEEAVWVAGGAYVFPTAAMGMEVVSTSVEDDILTAVPAPGTGVHKIIIFYLDADYEEKTVEVTLNGTTAVATSVTDIFRINGVRVLEVGSAGSAVGSISVRHLSDTPIYTQIAPGHTRARTAVYTVPARKTLFITSLTFSALSGASKNMIFSVKSNYDPTQDKQCGVFCLHHEVGIEDGSVYKALEIPTVLIAKTDMLVVGKGSGISVCMCGLRGWLET